MLVFFYSYKLVFVLITTKEIAMDTLDVQVINRDAVDLTDDQINQLLYECGYSMSQDDDPLANEPILIFMDIGDFSLEDEDEDIVLK